jgi:hypothetical protein
VDRLKICLLLLLLIPAAVMYGKRDKVFNCRGMISNLQKNIWPVVLTDQLHERYCRGTGKVIPHRSMILASLVTKYNTPLQLKGMSRKEKLIAINTRLANSNVYYLYKNAAIVTLNELQH